MNYFKSPGLLLQHSFRKYQESAAHWVKGRVSALFLALLNAKQCCEVAKLVCEYASFYFYIFQCFSHSKSGGQESIQKLLVLNLDTMIY